MEASLQRRYGLNHWPLLMYSTPAPLPSPVSGGWEWGGLPGNQFLALGAVPKSPNLHNKRHFFPGRIFCLFVREGKGGRKTGRVTSMDCLPSIHPQPGTEPATQACAQTRNWTGDLLVCKTWCPTNWITPARAFARGLWALCQKRG